MKFGILILSLAGFTSFAGDWPQWLGPTRNGYVSSDEKILKNLPIELTPIWKIQIGGGFSSPVVASNALIYFDENGEQEITHRIDTTTGKEIWRTPIATRFADDWGAGPRSTPFLDGDRVYVQSSNGEFRCLDLADGKILWSASFEKDFGVKFLGSKANKGTARRRGNSGSGIVDGNAVILPVGGTNAASLVCFDKFSGKVIWRSGDDEAAYSSLQVANLAGVRQVIAFTAEALMGVDRENGKQVWRIPLRTSAKRHAATPVIFGDNVIVNSHTFGLLCFKIIERNSQFEATQVWANKDLKINLATPVIVGNFLYSHGPDKNFICADAQTGKLKWAQPGFGEQTSSTLALGDKLLVLTDVGEMVLISENPERYSELARLQACGKNWNFPAYASGKLYLRDARELTCFDLLRQSIR